MIPCTLRQLEIFVKAAEDCHFVRTANRFGISQAAVSTHVAALEAQLGKKLFIRRRGTKPMLSSAGLAFLAEARSFLMEADRIRVFGGALNDRKRRTVRLCAGVHLLNDCIKLRLARFQQQHTEFDLECHYVETATRGAQLVKDGRMDLLVYTVANPRNYALDAEILRPVRFGLYACAEFASYRHASPAELSALPFILPPEGTDACSMVQAALLDAGIVCRNVSARAQFIAVGKDLARQGYGIVPLYETMVTPQETDLIKLDIELPTMYRALFRAHRAQDRPIESVAEFLRETLAA